MNTAMINMQLVMTFAITTALIVVIPGPSVMFIVSRALSAGRPAALAAAAGNTVGTTFQGILAAFGLGTLIAQSSLLYTLVKMGGALYLVLIGAKTLLNREMSDVDSDADSHAGRRRIARQGFLVGVTNPKIIVFFAAVLPQFVDSGRGHVVVQMLVLLAIYFVLSLISDTSWSFAGGSIRTWAAVSPQRIERLIGAGGMCIICLGLMLALSHSAG
jgi:threonine/homoserine/homoserine lactone efflux protein